MPWKWCGVDKKGKIRYALQYGWDRARLHCKRLTRFTSRKNLMRRNALLVSRGWSFINNHFLRRPTMATKRFVLGAVLVSVSALITACGGGGGGSDATSSVVDTVPPKAILANVAPAIGATDVPVNSALGIPFDKELLCGPEKAGTYGEIVGKLTCLNVSGKGFISVVPNVPYKTATRYTWRLSGYQDTKGNVGEEITGSFTTVSAPVATVTLTATPTTITVGDAATLTSVITNASNCLWSGGLTGSAVNTSGSVTVKPTVTTTYGIECWNSAGNSSGVKTATVTVNPALATHAHVGAILLMRNGVLHRVTAAGLLPNVNKTPWQFYGAVVNLTPRADCLFRLSALDNGTGKEHKLLYSLATGETLPDSSADGAALERYKDYVFQTPYDPTDHPEWVVKLHQPEGIYYVPNIASWSLYFRSLAGTVTDLTPGAAHLVTGINQGLWYVPACQVRTN